MSQEIHLKAGPAIGALHEVRAAFGDPDAMQQAVARLEMSGFDRADLSLPEAMPPVERATPEAGAKPVDTDEDARQARTLSTSSAAAAAGLAAAGQSSPRAAPRRRRLPPLWLAEERPAELPTCSAAWRAKANRWIANARRPAAT